MGAGAITRQAVGTPVFGGMIAASVFGIFVIPLFYITAESLRQRTRRKGTK
jgi:HAE1 family hydrophobic/amphiphilic exporter-1